MSLTKTLPLWAALLALVLPKPAAAQTLSVSARASAAILVPTAAIELRASGVPAPQVRAAIVEVRTARLPAPEVQVMLVRSRAVVEVHGPIPDFGAFIGVKIRGGFRGPRLYDVIEVEHRRRGHPGRGFMKGHYRDHHGPPGQIRLGYMGMGHGMGGVIVRGAHPMGGIRLHGPGPMGGVRVHGPMGGVRVHGPGPMGGVRVRGGGMAFHGGGHGGGGMGGGRGGGGMGMR